MTSSGKPGGLPEAVRQHGGWALTIGILMSLIGLVSIASPLITALAVTRLIGILLIVGGIGQGAFAIRMGAFGRGALLLLIGLIALLAGLFLLFQPAEGLASITLIMVGYFLAAGIIVILAAVQVRSVKGWVWMLANGVGTLGLGVLIWLQWPFAGAWAVGILFGIQLLMSGAALIALALAVRRDSRMAPV